MNAGTEANTAAATQPIDPGVRIGHVHLRDSINSTHIHISQKHMDRYLGEFSFRSNHRQMRNAMFDFLIAAL
jgi:hypothetical protein